MVLAVIDAAQGLRGHVVVLKCSCSRGLLLLVQPWCVGVIPHCSEAYNWLLNLQIVPTLPWLGHIVWDNVLIHSLDGIF